MDNQMVRHQRRFVPGSKKYYLVVVNTIFDILINMDLCGDIAKYKLLYLN